ncbi:GNAT family N-acetyltransferase [Streptomyces sp. YIM 98790]|uniref:GNAT family N-acetyltransferase n=1 Tax=Streptomyces sp. YIM 98790 TaxID=2689077 RepID=UPI00140A3F57|nr:GNAT family N-acetyltransferase [Streptomyces sp. YIM 98790]
MLIREATADDWPAIWPVFHKIVAAGDTYTYPPDLGEADARASWMQRPPFRTVVAVDEAGTVLGTARMNRNHQGPGSHVANAGYMVDPAHAGRGVGRALCEDSLAWARSAGYRIMQFNAVVETNVHAIRLYRSLGFEITGTLPGGFRHPTEGYIGLHIMHLVL